MKIVCIYVILLVSTTLQFADLAHSLNKDGLVAVFASTLNTLIDSTMFHSLDDIIYVNEKSLWGRNFSFTDITFTIDSITRDDCPASNFALSEDAQHISFSGKCDNPVFSGILHANWSVSILKLKTAFGSVGYRLNSTGFEYKLLTTLSGAIVSSSLATSFAKPSFMFIKGTALTENINRTINEVVSTLITKSISDEINKYSDVFPSLPM